MPITLTVIAGPHTGQAPFTFDGHDRFLVGRSAKAHFRLKPDGDKDLRVSRLHFLVEVNPPLCRLYDTNSRNKTFVNGQPVTVCDLRHGDEIRAGHTVLRVALDDLGPTTPPPAPTLPPIPGPATRLGIDVFGPATVPPAPAGRPPGSTPCSGCGAALPGPRCPRCRLDAEERPQPLPGYLLMRELGRGAMGVVYLALRREDQELRAVKMIVPAGVPGPGAVQRFLREAGILRELEHPHIVRFHELGEEAGALYFAMDYVPGTDAARVLKAEGPLGVRRAARLVHQVLQALEYAHKQGIVHRDIKPANLLMLQRPDGRKSVQVADFGLARTYQASQLSGLTLQNQFGGTLGYMPPEQITNFREVRPPADQYSAAATLYHLLTGSYVHDLQGPIHEQLDTILKGKPVPIQDRRPELSDELAGVIHRALACDPDDRFLDAKAFRLALLPFAR